MSGQYNEAQKQSLAAAATEIRDLLSSLEAEYGGDTNGKIKIAQETIRELKTNPGLAKRIYSALKAGGTAAIDSWLDSPSASFAIEAIKDWYESGTPEQDS